MNDGNARFHLALDVADLERSIAFYTDLLGREPDKVRSAYARFQLDEPPLVLALNAGVAGALRGRGSGRVAHGGIRVRTSAELAAYRERVVAAGHSVRDQRSTLCCHSVQDKFWVEDPDGVLWEIYELLDDDPERRPPADAASRRCCP